MPKLKASLAERLLLQSEVVENGCRRWTGQHINKGYGRISVNGVGKCVHVAAYEIWVGPIPDGHDVDHVYARGCRYRDCIEPTHLEAVTHAENIRRMAALITHCPQGHEYTPDNIKWQRRPTRISPTRRCRRCFNDRRNASRRKARADAAS